LLELGRDITGEFASAEAREWLCTNGIGGFASGTIAGSLARRYHGLLVAALAPPLGRTLVATKLEEVVSYGGVTWELGATAGRVGASRPRATASSSDFVSRPACRSGPMPAPTLSSRSACGWSTGANTTYVQYRLLRALDPAGLVVKALVNYRDYHSTTQAAGWRMGVEAAPHGLVVTAFDGARPVRILAPAATAEPAHDWYPGLRAPARDGARARPP
jgi:predicted glycogen debranching enzyme